MDNLFSLIFVALADDLLKFVIKIALGAFLVGAAVAGVVVALVI